LIVDCIEIFERHAQGYDKWFDKNKFLYNSELSALKRFMPKEGKGLEIGVGTGRFSLPLGIRIGIEPAKAMAEIAKKRSINVCRALAEELCFKKESFDFVLMVTTVCFLKDPVKAFKDIEGILKPEGYFIIGMIDKDSPVGKLYILKKDESKFYRYAHFLSIEKVLGWLKELNYRSIRVCQTIFNDPERMDSVDPVREGYGEGCFVVISAKKGKKEHYEDKS